jgi:hypothetical protein
MLCASHPIYLDRSRAGGRESHQAAGKSDLAQAVADDADTRFADLDRDT